MAKKTNRQANVNTPSAGKHSLPPQKMKEAQTAKVGGNIFQRPYVQLLIMAGLAIITWLFLKVCLNNQLTNWDDPGYIKDNAFIKDISSEGIKNIFSLSNPIMGNYHPLTILTYAIEYSYAQLRPEYYYIYHRDSLLFHIVVTLLVYWFVKILTRRDVAAIVAAILFGLHPMHVESVAWLAGRKDVVYGIFFMAALIAYVYYIRAAGSKKWLWYAGVIMLFLCSLLAKPVSVILPVALLLIDYFEGRKLDVSLFIDKILLFALSIVFGVKSVFDQRTFGALGTQSEHYSFIERIALGSYALITYIWKALLPWNLSCFYPYPTKVNGSLPTEYYLYPLAVIAILALLVWAYLRKKKVIVFGAMFFLVNIALLLQFIPVGGAILADRYTYIPYLGLFFLAGWAASEFFEPVGNKKIGYVVLAIVGVYSVYIGYLSNERCQVWYDTASLWRDEREQQPTTPNAYNNLGFEYFNRFNESVNNDDRRRYYDSAYMLLNKSISLQRDFANPYISLGELERSSNQFPEAKKNYYKAITLHDKTETPNAYLGLAIIYAITNQWDSSDLCFRLALKDKPYFPEAVGNYGNFLDMTGRTDEAIKEYGVAIAQNPDMYAPHLNRARALMRQKRYDEAMSDYNRALELNPQMGEIYYFRALCYAAKGNNAQAQQDAQKSRSLGYNPPANAPKP